MDKMKRNHQRQDLSYLYCIDYFGIAVLRFAGRWGVECGLRPPDDFSKYAVVEISEEGAAPVSIEPLTTERQSANRIFGE